MLEVRGFFPKRLFIMTFALFMCTSYFLMLTKLYQHHRDNLRDSPSADLKNTKWTRLLCLESLRSLNCFTRVNLQMLVTQTPITACMNVALALGPFETDQYT